MNETHHYGGYNYVPIRDMLVKTGLKENHYAVARKIFKKNEGIVGK
ncbi:hypothetical protein AN619_01310 [Thermotalea metallivorans]|uniref:Uncharacterized protein n=1 Tax=Thermotalea metallivorans TaxID=520762 RepID=A0A140LEJ6_9FIRM|nr:hypothetical protein AN619_01310 [Thermotalea metallivorans]